MTTKNSAGAPLGPAEPKLSQPASAADAEREAMLESLRRFGTIPPETTQAAFAKDRPKKPSESAPSSSTTTATQVQAPPNSAVSHDEGLFLAKEFERIVKPDGSVSIVEVASEPLIPNRSSAQGTQVLPADERQKSDTKPRPGSSVVVNESHEPPGWSKADSLKATRIIPGRKKRSKSRIGVLIVGGGVVLLMVALAVLLRGGPTANSPVPPRTESRIDEPALQQANAPASHVEALHAEPPKATVRAVEAKAVPEVAAPRSVPVPLRPTRAVKSEPTKAERPKQRATTETQERVKPAVEERKPPAPAQADPLYGIP